MTTREYIRGSVCDEIAEWLCSSGEPSATSIYQNCRTQEQIKEAFDALQLELDDRMTMPGKKQ